ncbi:unnamed protein product [Closterium sp. NIES-54]
MVQRIASHGLNPKHAVLAVTAVVVVVVSLLSSFPCAAASGLPGPWTAVKDAATNKDVEALARFAVDAQNKKQKSSLNFRSVKAASHKVVDGDKWQIILRVTQASPRNSMGRRAVAPLTDYVAEIWDQPWSGFRVLLSFDKAK